MNRRGRARPGRETGGRSFWRMMTVPTFMNHQARRRFDNRGRMARRKRCGLVNEVRFDQGILCAGGGECEQTGKEWAFHDAVAIAGGRRDALKFLDFAAAPFIPHGC